MAGFENTIVFSSGEKLSPSSADDIARMQENVTDVSRINFTGNPEGNVSANPGSLCHDPVSGNIYYKQSGTGNSGWLVIISSTFNWSVVTSATNPNSLTKTNGYIPKGAGVVDFILPASAAIGDNFIIAGYGNLWTLGQNANQSITLGVNTTTIGVTGSIAATQVRDSVEIVCVTANTEFQIINGIGNLTFI